MPLARENIFERYITQIIAETKHHDTGPSFTDAHALGCCCAAVVVVAALVVIVHPSAGP